MEKSAIEWLMRVLSDGRMIHGATFNPWIGCTHDGPDCLNCYAETLMAKRWKRVTWGKHQPRLRTGADTWNKPRRWHAEAVAGGYRLPVFCASVADWADQEVPQAWRDELFALVYDTPNIDWLMLTKRTRHVLQSLPAAWRGDDGQPCWNAIPWHIWWMFSAGDQQRFDGRWPFIEPFAQARRIVGVSAEPLFGALSLPHSFLQYGKQAWVIVGGESGVSRDKIRPTDIKWVRHLRDQCMEAGVPFFMKQLGLHLALELGLPRGKGGNVQDFPPDLQIREYPVYPKNILVGSEGRLVV